MKKRINYYDNVKGILILLIIFAHVISLTKNYYNLDTKVLKILSLFMVQCFFFISGYFSSKSKKPKIDKIKKQLKIYIIWQIIITIIFAYILNTISFSINIFIPRFSLWFILTLLLYNIFEYIFDKFNYKKVIIISMIIGLFSGFIPCIGRFLSLSRALLFLPFYVFGYYFNNFDIKDKIKNKKTIFIILSILIIIFMLCSGNFFTLKFLKGRHNFYEFSDNVFISFIKRIIFYIFSIIISTTFLLIVNNKNTILTKLGRNTLYIYLIQGIIIKIFIHYKLLFNNLYIGIPALYIETLFISILLSIFINKMKLLEMKIWKKNL